ncbi:CerR family C-terminal domain-containing protein [Amorphus sp. MBR-141]
MGVTPATIEAETNGHAARSSETRARTIEAAIEVFGALGYEGATTRMLADKARVNLAAIPYHFGGKRELYVAAAQAIADHANDVLEPITVRLERSGDVDPVVRIDGALRDFVQVVVGGQEPRHWIAFLVRCEHEADEAFEIIYETAIARFSRAFTSVAAEATGRTPDDEDLRIQVACILASIINFRALHNMALRSLGWERLGQRELARLGAIIRQSALRELGLADRPLPRAGDRPRGRGRRGARRLTFFHKPPVLARHRTRKEEPTMTKQSRAHEQVEWTKQKLDEIDATLASLEKSVDDVRGDARKDADRALGRLKAAREAYAKKVDTLRADVDAARDVADAVYDSLEAEWDEIELAFQSFLTAAADQADVAKAAVSARAEAQRLSWQHSVDAIRASASQAVDRAHGEFDAALERLDAARFKVEAKLGQASAAGDESWQAVKDGIDQTRQAHERTWKKISEAISKIA